MTHLSSPSRVLALGLLLALGSGSAQTPFADAFPLRAGSALQRGKTYRSPSGNHTLLFAGDGNLVINRANDNGFVWGLNQLARRYSLSDRVELRADGAFVVLNDRGGLVWQAPLKRLDPNAVLTLSDSGALQVVTGNGTEILWASDGNVLPLVSFAEKLPLDSPAALTPGKSYTSPSGLHSLTFGQDGNLVVKQIRNDRYVWGLMDQVRNLGKPVRAELRSDHSFALLEGNGRVAWQPSVNRPGHSLTVNFSGALQIRAQDGGIVWSSDGNLEPGIDVGQPAAVTGCTPQDEGAAGWDKCIKMDQPKIVILGSRRATRKAMNAVAQVYQAMTSRFTSAYPVSKLDGFKVYVTNGETGADLQSLPTVGTMWKGTGQESGDFLQGGASQDYLWLTEEMICHEGVPSRNNNMATLGMSQPDYELRTFDQVVHEMGHSLHFRYGIADRSENWAWTNQAWFSVPAGMSPTYASMERTASALYSSRASFSCERYLSAPAPPIPRPGPRPGAQPAPAPPAVSSSDLELKQSPRGSLQGAFQANGFALQWQADGNVCLNKGSEVWAGWCLNSETSAYQNARQVVFRRGTLYVLDGAGRNLWHSPLHDNPSAKLGITPQGVLQIVDGAGKVLWSKGGNR